MLRVLGLRPTHHWRSKGGTTAAEVRARPADGHDIPWFDAAAMWGYTAVLAHVGPGHIQQLMDDRKECSLELTSWHTMTLSPPLVALVGQSENHIFVRLCGTLSFFLHVGTTTVPGQRFWFHLTFVTVTDHHLANLGFTKGQNRAKSKLTTAQQPNEIHSHTDLFCFHPIFLRGAALLPLQPWMPPRPVPPAGMRTLRPRACAPSCGRQWGRARLSEPKRCRRQSVGNTFLKIKN